jgi:hypothetical protein
MGHYELSLSSNTGNWLKSFFSYDSHVKLSTVESQITSKINTFVYRFILFLSLGLRLRLGIFYYCLLQGENFRYRGNVYIFILCRIRKGGGNVDIEMKLANEMSNLTFASC